MPTACSTGPASPLPADIDHTIDRLLAGLQWETTVFHVGRYCGESWRASTAGHAMAGFHIVLHGQCYLHRPGQPPLALASGDGVFLLADTPHALSPQPDAPLPACAGPAMRPLASGAAGAAEGTGLACGFFQFTGSLSALLLRALPQVLVLRAAGDAAPAALLVDCMLREARSAHAAHGADAALSPVVARLTDLLFFYVVRHAAREGSVPAGLWRLLRDPALAPLLARLLDAPGQAWTVEQMAQAVHMSRARFFRAFQSACGVAPAQFLATLRMQVAAQRMERGESIARAAEHVGYQSYAAFSRAFKKANGLQPGAWQRLRMQPGARPPH
ncbi:AraC family transcriptional regulator [Paracidovorax wautersii]|uniref:AraC family transcriptional activator of mtrCDE n=1 Tax=Paracidovorax wautersii TaxID=1177982 RepID=A0ABU1I9X8_9BURK|nr:AraC family transcriptional regulator [Paracidovorax wautersii]MDR6213069.1 AraC family transcriptional activator of mtrCDE [Paracidovorax wautersii]